MNGGGIRKRMKMPEEGQKSNQNSNRNSIQDRNQKRDYKKKLPVIISCLLCTGLLAGCESKIIVSLDDTQRVSVTEGKNNVTEKTKDTQKTSESEKPGETESQKPTEKPKETESQEPTEKQKETESQEPSETESQSQKITESPEQKTGITIAELRSRIKSEGKLCAASFLGYIDKNETLQNFLKNNKSSFEEYPFLAEIGEENCLDGSGTEVFCILPAGEQQTLLVCEALDQDNDTQFRTLLETVGKPVIVRSNFPVGADDLVFFIVNSNVDETLFVPRMSAKEGKLVSYENNLLDFSVASGYIFPEQSAVTDGYWEYMEDFIAIGLTLYPNGTYGYYYGDLYYTGSYGAENLEKWKNGEEVKVTFKVEKKAQGASEEMNRHDVSEYLIQRKGSIIKVTWLSGMPLATGHELNPIVFDFKQWE